VKCPLPWFAYYNKAYNESGNMKRFYFAILITGQLGMVLGRLVMVLLLLMMRRRRFISFGVSFVVPPLSFIIILITTVKDYIYLIINTK
jgi:hypothetical protein